MTGGRRRVGGEFSQPAAGGEQRGLARQPELPSSANQPPRFDGEIDVSTGDDSAEALVDACDADDRAALTSTAPS